MKAEELLHLGYEVYASDFNWDTGQWEVPDERTPAKYRVKKVSLVKKGPPQPHQDEVVRRDQQDDPVWVTLICNKCGQHKPPNHFYKRPSQYSGGRGYSYACKKCTKASQSKSS